MGAFFVVSRAINVVIGGGTESGPRDEVEPVVEAHGKGEFLPEVQAGVAMFGQDGVDFGDARVAGLEGGRFGLQAAPPEGGNVFVVETGHELSFVQNRRVEEGMPDLVEGELGQAGIGLVKGVGTQPGPQGEQVAFAPVGESEGVVGVGFYPEGAWVVILQVEAVTEVGQVGVEVAGAAREDVGEPEAVAQLEAEAVFGHVLAPDATPVSGRVEVVDVVELEPAQVRVFALAGIEEVDTGSCPASGKQVEVPLGEQPCVPAFAGPGVFVASEHEPIAVEEVGAPV